jgi:hypothetical protein
MYALAKSMNSKKDKLFSPEKEAVATDDPDPAACVFRREGEEKEGVLSSACSVLCFCFCFCSCLARAVEAA